MPNVEIYIPLASYLKKYQLGECGGDVLYINQKHEIGIIVLALLKQQPDHTFKSRKCPEPNEMVLSIADRLCNDKGRGKFLHEEGKKMIARKIRKMFLFDLRFYVRQNHLDFGTPEKYALRNFFEKYKISEDDFDEGSMYRDYTRWKKERKVEN